MDKVFYIKAFEIVVLSGFAWTSAIRFMFSLFRLKVNGPWLHASLLSMMMMLIIWAVDLLIGSLYSAAFQFSIILLYLIFILRLKWFHALLVDAIGCLITLFVMVASNLLFVPPEKILSASTGEHPLWHLFEVLLTFFIFSIAVQVCDRYRLGFVFVGAHSRTAPVRLSYKFPLSLFAVTVAAVLVFPPAVAEFVPYLLAIAAVCLFFLLRWSIKYEMTE
jgi:hypothetical protein